MPITLRSLRSPAHAFTLAVALALGGCPGADDDDASPPDDDDTGHGDDDDTGHGDDDDTGHGDDDDSGHGDDDDSTAAPPVWAGDIATMLQPYCGDCHAGDAAGSGGIGWLNSYANVSATAENTFSCTGSRAACLPVRIQSGEMPAGGPCLPGDPGCITLDEFARLQAWVAAGAPET